MSEAISRIDERTGAIVRSPSPSSWGVGALAAMSPEEFGHRIDLLKAGMERMKELHVALMEEGVDYGTVPGIDKPFLYQSGAEKLTLFYQLAPSHVVEITAGDGISAPPLSVVVRCQLHVGSTDGPIVGEGVGAANSWETKHRRRYAELRCPFCDTPNIRKSKQDDGGWFCWKKLNGCGATFPDGDSRIEKQERGQIDNPDPWDLQNTLLKMARKRALVDATKGTTGTSWLYSQDPDAVEGSSSATPREQKQAQPTQGRQPREPRTPRPESSGDRAATNGGKCSECNAPNGKPHTSKCSIGKGGAPAPAPPATAAPASPAAASPKPAAPAEEGDRKALLDNLRATYESAGGDWSNPDLTKQLLGQVLTEVLGERTAILDIPRMPVQWLKLAAEHIFVEGLPAVVPGPSDDDPGYDEPYE